MSRPRGKTPATHCLRGHPLEGANLHTRTNTKGKVERNCKTCRRESNKRTHQARKQRRIEQLLSAQNKVDFRTLYPDS